MGFSRTSYAMRPKAGVYAYLSAQATTTVTTGDTFEYISGTFGNDPFEGFSGTTVGGGDAIQYDGDTCVFEIDWHAAFSSQDNSRVVRIGIAKNGETLTTTSPSVMSIYCKTGGELFSLSGTLVLTLDAGDTIQLMVTSDTNLDEVTFDNFTTTIRRFFY